MSKFTLPVRLALLVVTTLPLILFAVGLAYYNYHRERNAATRRVLENVRSMRLVLESEVQRMTGGLQVLALTDALPNGEFKKFRRIALGFLDQYGKGGLVLVSDRKGRLLFSSATEDTANLPLRNNLETIEKVFATKALNIRISSPARSNNGRSSLSWSPYCAMARRSTTSASALRSAFFRSW